MRVLAVRQPFASLIAEGFKTIEIRGHASRIREDIAIYASRTPAFQEDIAQMDFLFNYKLDGAWSGELPISRDVDQISECLLPFPLPYGQILAIVSLVNSRFLSRSEFLDLELKHWARDEFYNKDKTYGWELENIRKVDPFDFKFSGSIVWGKIDENLLKEVV